MSQNKKTPPLTVGSLQQLLGGSSVISKTRLSKKVGTIWYDSRKVTPGDLFVAIKTERDDGHNYVASALSQGATAAIVNKRSLGLFTDAQAKYLIAVDDPLTSIQKAAASYRKEMGILFVGITGSSGKTTTRTFIAEILKKVIKVGETFSNWNNHIGVPLSILRFAGDEWAGVIEMGANHVGEISELSKITQPDIAVITNIGYAHVGLFGSLAKTTTAKFEIVDGLNKKSGFALLNGDDPRLVKGARERELPTVFFGTSEHCQVRAENISLTRSGKLSFTVGDYHFTMNATGRHFIYSALPAIYIARRCRVPDEIIAEALAEQKPLALRGAIEKRKGANFIVDCYNANPSSMTNAIQYLCDMSDKNRVAVVGDMLELGRYSVKLHQELGRQLFDANIRDIIAVGTFAEQIKAGATEAGMKPERIFVAKDADAALVIAKKIIKKGDTVLLKGSRGVHLETVFDGFSSKGKKTGSSHV